MAHEDAIKIDSRIECFIESVLVLAFNSGVERKDALRHFDMHQKFASNTWNQIVEDAAGSEMERK